MKKPKRLTILELTCKELAALLGLHASFDIVSVNTNRRYGSETVELLVSQVDDAPLDTNIEYMCDKSLPAYRCIENILPMLQVSPYLPRSKAREKLFLDWMKHREEMEEKRNIEEAKRILENNKRVN